MLTLYYVYMAKQKINCRYLVFVDVTADLHIFKSVPNLYLTE